MAKRRIFTSSRPTAAGADRRRDHWLHPVACALVLAAPFLVFIKHQDYGLLTPEVAAILLALAGAGLGLGLVLRGAGARARALGLFVLLVLFADVQFGWNSIAERPLALLSVAILPVAWLLRAHLAEIATATFAVILLATLLLPGAPAEGEAAKPAATAVSRPDLPSVLHLVLDEHASLEGILTQVSGGAELRDRLRAFYTQRGFRLYAKAYSRHAETASSLAHTVNPPDPASALAGGLLAISRGCGAPVTDCGFGRRATSIFAARSTRRSPIVAPARPTTSRRSAIPGSRQARRPGRSRSSMRSARRSTRVPG